MTDMTYGQSKRLGAFSAFGAGKKAMLAILRSLAGRRSRNEKASSDLLLALRLKISMPCVSLRVFLGSIFAAFMLAATTSSPAVATSGASVSSSPYSPAVVRVHQQEDEQEHEEQYKPCRDLVAEHPLQKRGGHVQLHGRV